MSGVKLLHSFERLMDNPFQFTIDFPILWLIRLFSLRDSFLLQNFSLAMILLTTFSYILHISKITTQMYISHVVVYVLFYESENRHDENSSKIMISLVWSHSRNTMA